MTRGLVALLAHLVFLALAFGWRTLIHRRRTGDSGFRWQRHDRIARLSSALFVAAIVVGTLGVIVAAISASALWGALAGPGVFVAGLVCFGVGCAITLVAQSEMGASWRIGVDPTERTGLVTGGLFGLVRNPIFTGMVIAAAGLALIAPTVLTLTSVLLLAIAVRVQVVFVEEPHLRGSATSWSDYAARVGRFVPALGRLRG